MPIRFKQFFTSLLCRAALAISLAGVGGVAPAATVHVVIDTSGFGAASGYLDLQFSATAGVPLATVLLSNLAGFDSAAYIDTWGVTAVAGGYQFRNDVSNDLFHAAGFGGKLSFDLTFAGDADPAASYISRFVVSAYDSAIAPLGHYDPLTGALAEFRWTPALTAQGQGNVAIQIADPAAVSLVPEPAAWLLLCAGGLVLTSALTARRQLAAPALLLAGLLPLEAAHAAPDRVQVHAFPNPVRYSHHNDDYTVRVRVPGGPWQDLFEYKVKVDLDKPQEASMVHFNFDGTVELAIQKNNGIFSKVTVRPDAKGVKPVVKDGIVYLTLKRPENLSVEFNDDRLHNLHVFTHAIRADMPETPKLSSNDIGTGKAPDLTQKTVFFGPGVHSGEFHVRSHTKVYIHGSAILKNPLILDGVEDVQVYSDGLFDGVEMTTIRNSRNIAIDGPIFINQPHGTMRCITSQDVTERAIRTIGAGQWSDGLGHFACERVTISDSFIRTSDDCLTFYNHRWDIWGNTRDVQVKDSTLWADVAHAVMIGIHGNTPSAAHPDSEVLERLRFSNLDILEHDEDDPEYEGALGIMAGDDNLVRDVVFEDIRVDRIEEGKLFNLKIAYTAKYNTSPGLGIENVTLRNIHYTGKGSPGASAITGRDAQRKVKNITIENVTVGGLRITKPDAELLEVNEFTEGIRFR
jgi:hypothetical protein